MIGGVTRNALRPDAPLVPADRNHKITCIRLADVFQPLYHWSDSRAPPASIEKENRAISSSFALSSPTLESRRNEQLPYLVTALVALISASRDQTDYRESSVTECHTDRNQHVPRQLLPGFEQPAPRISP